MLLRNLSAGLSTVALISVLPASASAVGLEANVRLGYGSAGSESPVVYEPRNSALADPGPILGKTSAPYGGGFIFQGGIGLRTGKYVSVGLGGGARSSSAESPSASITDLKRSGWSAGPYVRVYIPMVPVVDPYVGLGVEYVNDRQQWTQPVQTTIGPMPATYALEHHGIGVPLTLGVDYTLAKMFSFGPYFQYELVFPAGGCSTVNANNQASLKDCAADNKRFTAVKGYGIWSLGLSLRLTVPPM